MGAFEAGKASRTLYIRGMDEETWRLMRVAAGRQGLDVKTWITRAVRAQIKQELGDITERIIPKT